ncbi:NAD(P)-dependent alcohol dehydrogenase [Mediterraneibacter massiliensis]|uniref:NAD(P)-dependent alcohol dehydrogenase n=1 Tax=Mediterraneibacter massiliensis TaxID=1720300 RepID=UPI0022E42135|nr:NAD(P)-dependent alcohol dehydrogenase [Mediterraneibacter massiliensis]
MVNQTAYLTEPEKFEIRESPMPVCGDDEVLVQIKHVGICGSDVMFYQEPTLGGALDVELPIVLGHECAGIIVETGKNVKHLAKGDKVALEPGIPCGKCEYCLSGQYNLCPEVNFMAAPPWKSAALHKYVSHPAAFAFKLPDTMDTIEGAMIEPLAVGVHAANRAQVQPGKSILILGAGCIGLMTLLACRGRGATDITVVDLFENRLEKALELGASRVINAKEKNVIEEIDRMTNKQGMHIVFETAGNKITAQQVPYLVKAGGKAVMVGNVHGNPEMDLFAMNNKEADILSVFRYRNIYPMAIEGVASGNIPVKKVATNFFTFDQVNEAFACALKEKQTALKVVIEF